MKNVFIRRLDDVDAVLYTQIHSFHTITATVRSEIIQYWIYSVYLLSPFYLFHIGVSAK